MMLSSGLSGNIANALNKSDVTSPAFEHSVDGASPDILQKDLVTTPGGCWKSITSTNDFRYYFIRSIHQLGEE